MVPVQLYHSLVGLLLFALLWRPREAPGRRLGMLLFGYGAERFLLERWRGDFQALAGPLSLQQLISLALLTAGAALWLRGLQREPAAALG